MKQEITRCHECGEEIPQSRTRIGRLCRATGLCKYCYKHGLDQHQASDRPSISQDGEKLLSWSERREMEQDGFNPEVWSPEFREEMRDYWKARMRGEV